MILSGVLFLTLLLIVYRREKRFALRDTLQKSDAIVALAGTRGNIKFLESKVRTAARLYHEGWASLLIFSGRFSKGVTDQPKLIPISELEQAVAEGCLASKDLDIAATMWDTSLGADYMRNLAINLGVPAESIVIEDKSLHTLENAEFTADILRRNNVHQIILVTSPFHQLRTFLTFKGVLTPQNIRVHNYYADAGEWHPATWFWSARNRTLVKSEMQRMKTYHLEEN